MREKLGILEFISIKKQLQKLLTKIDIQNINISIPEVSEYIALEEKLASYDLSNIPFGTWKNLTIINLEEHPIDFSKSNAKLNFKVIKVYGIGNYNNCQTKNIKYLGKSLNPISFDLDTFLKNSNTFLSNDIPQHIQEKFYNNKLTFEDMLELESNQKILNELFDKNLCLHLDFSKYNEVLFNILGFSKMQLLYKVSQWTNDSKTHNHFNKVNTFFELIYNSNINKDSKIYKNFINYLKKSGIINLLNYCHNFFEDNVLPNNELDAKAFIKYSDDALELSNIISYENFKKLVNKHKDFFTYILRYDSFKNILDCFHKTNDYENDFIRAVKKYYKAFYPTDTSFPTWLDSFKFKRVSQYNNWQGMATYSEKVFLENYLQRTFINRFGIDNLRRFESETGFFTHENTINLYKDANIQKITLNGFFEYYDLINFDYANMNYKEFLILFADFLIYLKSHYYGINYDFIEGPFRDNHPNAFIDKNAPEELKERFYNQHIDEDFIFLNSNMNYTTYLLDKDLVAIFDYNYEKYNFYLENSITGKRHESNFINYYSERFGNEEMLNLFKKYGHFTKYIRESSILDNLTQIEIENFLKKEIYNAIKSNGTINYTILSKNENFVKEFPDIFINLSNITSISESEKDKIQKKYYKRHFEFNDIKQYPELVDILKDKEIALCFTPSCYGNSILIDTIGKNVFLELCSIYGNYLSIFTSLLHVESQKKVIKDCTENNKISITRLKKAIENIIAKTCYNGDYAIDKENAPEFLLKNHSELFLDDNAPKLLKCSFYQKLIHEHIEFINFETLYKHPGWLPYIENKNYVSAFLRTEAVFKDEYKKYFKLFTNNALSLGIKKSETVTKMIRNDKVELMKKWYDKTGHKFIPDYVVMENINIDEADKFLNSISLWSKLMKLNEFSDTRDSREAMLKLAYSFGVFHNDKAGFQKLYNLLTNIPQHISKDKAHILPQLHKSNEIQRIFNNELKNTLIKEGLKIDDSNDLLSYIYRKNDDGSYTLAINPQKYPKSVKLFREMMHCEAFLINEISIHQLFGGFKMEYNPDFREFLLNNLEDICTNYDYSKYIGSIQRQYKQIKAMNSNRVLTLELAVNFVKSAKYENIELGNEKMAEISAIAGYSQDDFDTLQQIYNYGKNRTFSSIPRIEGSLNECHYEMLRLDDPLALAIGTLTDCCQELHNAAEVCMEHSMIDNNGRIFVIKDNEDNIISQSWVWRNKDVLCFDNIEIPHKAFQRSSLSRLDFAKNVFDIYKKAAQELINEDERVYKKLLDENKITKEQYDGLRLGKVTVGLGYNDIADTIEKSAIKDNEKLARPIAYESKLLDNSLYTSDSTTQYVLEKRNDRINYNGDTLQVHNDSYRIYDDSNFTNTDLLILKKLESENKKSYNLYLNYLEYEENKTVSLIAETYDFTPENTRIIIHPNFAIIYEDKDSELTIGDLFYNSNSENKYYILIQIYLALKQIGVNKNIDASLLDDDQKQILSDVINLDNSDLIKIQTSR